MINRKIVWLSILVFTIILAGCGQNEKEVMMDENDMNVIYNHQVSKVKHFALDNRADGLKIDDGNAAPATVEFDTIQVLEGGNVNLTDKSESFIKNLISVQNEVADIWTDNFHHLYNKYLNEQAHVVQNDNLSLTDSQIEEVALRLEMLHTEYDDLEEDLDELTVPKSIADNNMGAVEAAIENISMAIENRALALIEFKSIYESEDYETHDELLSIHIENSDKYLSEADASINELVESVDDK